jgi:UDP-N-acetylglucosamine 2-epimerase (non-hydrolysing)
MSQDIQMKILTIVGARPNFMKVAPIIRAINEFNARINGASSAPGKQLAEPIQHVLVHTGQHYDEVMSGAFFDDLSLPKPNVHLGVGSGSHAAQTAEIMRKFEDVLLTERPDVVVVVGDVNSTVACALVTAKISFDQHDSKPLIAHVESGLRSFDRSMPEEVNRVVTDHVSDLLFVSEKSGLQNLRNEGIPASSIHFVGNTMIDSLLTFSPKADNSTILEELGLRKEPGKSIKGNNLPGRYALLTLHRPSNVDNKETFLNILAGLEELARDCPIVFPVHPRTRKRIEEFGLNFRDEVNSEKSGADLGTITSNGNGVILTRPLGYLDFLCMMKHAAMVVTDSGGIQEETTFLGVPCVTVRDNTERPVTVEYGTNMIAGTRGEKIREAVRLQMTRKRRNGVPENWDGHSATRIVNILVQSHGARTATG